MWRLRLEPELAGREVCLWDDKKGSEKDSGLIMITKSREY